MDLFKNPVQQNCFNPIDKQAEILKGIVGDDLPLEKIKQFLRGADGNVEIALNHILNHQEKNSATHFSAEKVLYELAEEVKCPLCLCYFVDPLILNCFHTFCADCLVTIVATANKVQCPLCRSVVQLDERGVKGLKSNHYLKNIVEKLKGVQPTRMCDECKNTLCTVVCKECKSFLCYSCNDKIHCSAQNNSDHIRVPFEECFFTAKKSSLGFEGVEINYESDCVIPFNVKKEVCSDLFHAWTREQWFMPTDLSKNAVLQEFKMMYIPYWRFDVDTTSKFTIGYRDKVLGNTIEIGNTSQSHKDIMICASNCPEVSLLQNIEPWKLDQTESFTLRHTEGAEVKSFVTNSENCWQIHAKSKVDAAAKEACRHQLTRNNRPSTLVSVEIISNYSNKTAKRLFVPIYSTTYEYEGRTYRFVINGSTAKSYGHRPYSKGKILSVGFTSVCASFGLFSSKLP